MIKYIRKSKHQQSKNKFKNTNLIVSEKKNGLILPIIIAFCLPIMLYLQTINFGFVGLDEDFIISDNITFLSNFGNVHQVFLTDAFIGKSISFYRPLQTLSYMVDIQLSGGNNIWMYHLSNILLFGLIAFSLFLFLKQLIIPTKLALLSTLVYCAHPLFVPFITWIPARGDLLLTLFSLLSFLFFLKFLQKKKNIFFFLNLTAFTIALFCKETAALLPFLFILYYIIFPAEKYFKKKYLFNIIFYAISWIFWFWLRSKAIGGISNKNDEVGLIPLLSNLRTIPESIAQFFLPTDINPMPVFSIFKTLMGLGIIFIIIIIFFKNREISKNKKIFCFSWFLILILPSMLCKDYCFDYFDHRFFLPLIGLLLFVLFIFPKKWFENGDIKRPWLMFTIFIFLFSFTFIKSRSYSNSMTFYNLVISQNPNSVLAFNNRGYEKNKIGDFQGCIKDCNKALAICPTYGKAYGNRGLAKINIGDNYGAIDDFNKAISFIPSSSQLYYDIGVSKTNIGNNLGAIEDYNKATVINPGFYQAYCNRGVVKSNIGDIPGAIEDYNMAIAINPRNDQAFCNRGVSKRKMGDNLGSIEDYNKAIAINPKNDQAYCNRGLAKTNIGDNTGAIEDYNKAVAINPKSAQGYYNRGFSKVNIGDTPGAIEDYNKAITIRPNYEEAFYNKGAVMGSIGNFNEALSNFNRAIEINPKYFQAYEYRAITKYNLKDLIGAIEDCEMVLKLNPNDEIILKLKDKCQHELKK